MGANFLGVGGGGRSEAAKEDAFTPLLKDILEASLEEKMEGHSDGEERANDNRKNGKTSKKLKTADGTIDLETPRDRAATFEPQLVKKRETILAESLESRIIGIYRHGMNFRDISHIKEMYDTEISAATLSSTTDKIILLTCLATQNIKKKWTQPLQNWSLTVSQLSIKFGDRLRLKI